MLSLFACGGLLPLAQLLLPRGGGPRAGGNRLAALLACQRLGGLLGCVPRCGGHSISCLLLFLLFYFGNKISKSLLNL